MKRILFLLLGLIICGVLNMAYSGGEKVYPAGESMITHVGASSVLKDTKNRYRSMFMTDGTAASWCEGKDDDGIGEKVIFTFERRVKVTEFHVMNGYGEADFWSKNNRVKELRITSDENKTVSVTLPDTPEKQVIKLPEAVEGKVITFTIVSVYPGTKYRDTCLTELAFINYKLGNEDIESFCGIEFDTFELDFYNAKITIDKDHNFNVKIKHEKAADCEVIASWASGGRINNNNEFRIDYTLESGTGGTCQPVQYGFKLDSCPADKNVIFKYDRYNQNDETRERRKIRCGFENKKGAVKINNCVDAGVY